MTQYKLFDRLSNYGGGFGAAKKEAIMDLSAHRLDQQIFPFDHSAEDFHRDGASTFITQAGLESRMKRDLSLDIKNPRQELPKSASDEKSIDVIPNLIAQMPDMSHPADYEAHNNVRLLQESRLHSTEQETLFTDPKALENPRLNTDGQGKDNRSVSQLQVFAFDGSAAGKESNHLVDEDGAYLNSVESVNAF